MGPFLEIHITPKIITKNLCKYPNSCKYPDSCRDPDKSDTYCSKCGIKLDNKFYTTSVTDIYDHPCIGIELYIIKSKNEGDTTIYYLGPNIFRNAPRNFNINDTVVKLNSFVIDIEINWFKSAFSVELSELESLKNSGNFSYFNISWGGIAYWS